MPKKLTYKEVKRVFESRGYQLLSTEYFNNKSKLKYICPNRHEGEITFDSFRSGKGCPICGREQAKQKNLDTLFREADKKRLSFDKVKKEFEEHGFTLISTEYKNNQTSLNCICPEGHRITTNYKSFHIHHSCKKCVQEKAGINSWKDRRKSLEEIQEYFKDRKEKIVGNFFKNGRQYLDIICENGHESIKSYSAFKRGSGCKICSCSNNAKKQLKIETVFDVIKNSGYTLLSNFESSKKKLVLKCEKGHVFEMRWNDFQQGHRCPICMQSISTGEQEIFNFLKSYFLDVYNRDRKLISPKELDIVIPSKKVAIEYCGLYWHSEQMGKERYYHFNKWKQCKDRGYQLITIFEDEWLNHKDIVLSRLSNILKIPNQETIFARKCKIKEIDSKTKNKFLDANHIQGKDRSRIKLGAFFDDRLISVMTFSVPSIAKGKKFKEDVFELNRFCSEQGIICTGIASRLFKYFIKKYKPKEVYSYADIRWSTGKLYSNLGFYFDGYSAPNYWYIYKYKRIHRFNFRKNVLDRKLIEFNPDLTETQNMNNNGFTRVWDCGNLKFIKNFLE